MKTNAERARELAQIKMDGQNRKHERTDEQ